MANPNILRAAGQSFPGNVTVMKDLTVLGNINEGMQQAVVNASAAAGLLNRLTGQFAPPGTIWNSVANPFADTNAFHFAFGNSIFIGLNQVGKIAKSTDNGNTWTTPATPFSTSGKGIAFGNGVWIAVGDTAKIYRSTNDGGSWGSIINNFVAAITTVAYSNLTFIAADASGNVSYSTDFGLTWSALYSLPSASSVSRFSFGNSVWVAVGTGNPPKIWSSTNNGQTFSAVTSPFSGNLNIDVNFGQGFFLALSGASGVIPTAYRSSDGSSWTSVTIPLVAADDPGLPVVGWGNNTFLITESGGGNGTRIAISLDIGATWAIISNGNGNSPDIVFGNRTFVFQTYNFYAGITNIMWSSWLSYGKSYLYVPSFQGFGTPTGVNFFWQRKPGSNTITIFGKFTSGTPTAVEARIGLPVGLVSDSALIPSVQGCGMFLRNASAATYFGAYCLIESGVGYITISIQTSTSAAMGKQIGSNIIGTGETVSLVFELPVSGWN